MTQTLLARPGLLQARRANISNTRTMEYRIRHRLPAGALSVASRRRPDARAALIAGLVGGMLLFILLQLFATTVFDEPFWRLPRLIAAMVRGPDAIEPDDEPDQALLLIAIALWTSLSLLYSLALACLLTDIPRQYAAWTGLAFGAALYFINFYGFTTLFEWFTPYRTLDTLVAHALFGATTALVYTASRRRTRYRR